MHLHLCFEMTSPPLLEVTFLKVEMVNYLCTSPVILAIILSPVCTYGLLYSKKAMGTLEKVLRGKNPWIVKRSGIKNL